MAPLIEIHPILGPVLLILLAVVIFIASNFRELFVKEDGKELDKVVRDENNPK
ncbi:MAG TPA: hypothetical protein PKL88_01550 [bacterium]|nr:hypothetical protein [bacterium]